MSNLTQQVTQLVENTNRLLQDYENWSNEVNSKIQELEDLKTQYTNDLDQKKNEWDTAHPETINKVMTRDEFEALAEHRRRIYAGSGFVEVGKYLNNSDFDVINDSALMTSIHDQTWFSSLLPNTFMLGYYMANAGTSKTIWPIVNVHGYVSILRSINGESWNYIKVPKPLFTPEKLYEYVLVYYEGWFEDVSVKDAVFPYGNVQYNGNSPWSGVSLQPITVLGIEQGYSAFGPWDTETVGNGAKWSSLTQDQKQMIMSDPVHNLFINNGKVIQWRYRIKSISRPVEYGPSHSTYSVINNIRSTYLDNGYSDTSGWKNICAQGMSEDSSITYGYNAVTTSFKSIASVFIEGEYGAFVTKGIDYSKSYTGRIFALPIAVVSRRNKGAFHFDYNPNGSAKFVGDKDWTEVIPTAPTFTIIDINIEDTDGDGENNLFQFVVSGDQTSEIKPNFYIKVENSTNNDGKYWVTNVEYNSENDQTIITVSTIIPSTTADGTLLSEFGYVKYCFDYADTNTGTIDSGISGRPDGLYADEIDEGSIKSLMCHAKKPSDLQDLLLNISDRCYLLRGWDYLPWGRIYKGECMFTGVITLKDNYVKNGGYCIHEYYAIQNSDIFIYQNGNDYNLKYTPNTNYFASVFNLDTNQPQQQLDVGSFYNSRHFRCHEKKGGDYSFGIDDGETFNGILVFPSYQSNFNAGKTKSILMRDIFGKDPTKAVLEPEGLFYGLWRMIDDYGSSFIPTDDFDATVDSTDISKITISNIDATYAIKKNSRIFFRDSTNNKAGSLRVKTVEYSDPDTIITIKNESGDTLVAGASIRISACIASGQADTTAEGKEIYIAKICRLPKDNKVKVYVKKKDGTWFKCNNGNDVPIWECPNDGDWSYVNQIQNFINSLSNTESVKYDAQHYHIAINITDLYEQLGYSSIDDFKEDAVIAVVYNADVSALKQIPASNFAIIIPSDKLFFHGYGHLHDKFKSIVGVLPIVPEKNDSVGNIYAYCQFSNLAYTPCVKSIYHPNISVIKSEFPELLSKCNNGYAVWFLLGSDGTYLKLIMVYNLVIYDYEQQSFGWIDSLMVTDYEYTYTDSNGNLYIAGVRSADLPYFYDYRELRV